MKEQRMKITMMRRHPRGAALMAALMMTLVLSGIGMVVMQSTMQSMRMSGNYKMRKQANAGAEAAVLYTSNLVGDQASTFWRGMESSTQTATNGGTFAANQEAIGRGGAMIVSNADQPNAGVPVMKVFQSALANGETGLFTNTAGALGSFEQKTSNGNVLNSNTFRVVLRDPVEGPPAPGYSERFCFKKIYFASATQYGALNALEATDWTKPPLTVATARNGMEGFIGPIECGAR
jgi:Tfp pilus assembly protein PilX